MLQVSAIKAANALKNSGGPSSITGARDQDVCFQLTCMINNSTYVYIYISFSYIVSDPDPGNIRNFISTQYFASNVWIDYGSSNDGAKLFHVVSEAKSCVFF